jgi:hypothetical protein
MGFFNDIRNLQRQAVARADQALDDTAAEGHRARYLMANGRQGSATIEAIRDTGLTVNDNPTVELELSVSLEGSAAYGVTHKQTISRIAIPSFQPGATVPVRVDPVDPLSLMIG